MESVGSASAPSEEPATAQQRQRAIWTSRVHREFEKCRVAGALSLGAMLRRVQVSERRGVCEGEFHCFVPFPEGSDALALVPLTSLIVRMPFSPERLANGEAQYPFLAPEVEICHGAIYLPHEMRIRQLKQSDSESGEQVESKAPTYLLRLPLLEQWSPSTTLVMLVNEFFSLIQQNDPQPASPAKASSAQQNGSGQSAGQARNKRPMRMRKRDIRGAVYSCQEMDPNSSTLRSTAMLVQSGNIALLVPSSEATGDRKRPGDDDYVYVGDLIPLRDVVRITPQRGKSLTLFFQDRSLPCRTFFSRQTDEIVNDLRAMIGASSGANKRGRDGAEAAAGTGSSAAQLLPFLSAEHTEKAKEMSSKFMGKLGKVATSFSRFIHGEEENQQRRAASDPLATAFAQIESQKEAFYRTPSKARMTEITRRYQHIAEEYAHLNSHEGYVERAIGELQVFIEHPKTQRILMETCAYEQSTRGIRVGPA
ncbi:hypothetical protein BBJ28_00003808 [Nothophytophthora sp. Chile5]|nr:hypothetical protein BBJ28_00003808 [Nothophytophthora sp. Chile5]